MQCAVELAVSGPVKPVAHGGAAASRNGRSAGEGREGGFAANAVAVGPGDEELGGGDDADSGAFEQLRASGGDEELEFGLVFCGFGFQHQCATSSGSDGAYGGAGLHGMAGECAESGASGELFVGGAAAQLIAQRLGRVDDERLELSNCFSARDDCAITGRQQYPHCLAVTACPRGSEVLTSQCLARGPDGIEVI